MVQKVEETLYELPKNPPLKVLYIPAKCDLSVGPPLPTPLYSQLILDLLTIPIAVFCQTGQYRLAESWKIRTFPYFPPEIDFESNLNLDIDPIFTSNTGKSLYSAAVSSNSIENYHKALDFWFNIEPFGASAMWLLVFLGNFYYGKKDESQALLCYRKAEGVMTRRRCVETGCVLVRLRLAQLMRDYGYGVTEVVRCLKMAMKACEQNMEERSSQTDVMFFLAKMYVEGCALDKAEQMYQACLDIMETQDSQYKKLAGVYYHFGVAQFKSHQYPRAEYFYEKAISADCHLVDNFNLNDLHLSLVELYLSWQKPKEHELAHQRAFLQSTTRKAYSLVSEWGKKLLMLYRSTGRRQYEETVACLTIKSVSTGPNSYYRYESIRAIRGLYPY